MQPSPADLPFCRQFYLGAAQPQECSGWRTFALGPHLKLSVHPELAAAQHGEGDDSLALLGFLFDAEVPGKSTSETLRQLWPLRNDRDALMALTDRMSGRWIIIVNAGGRSWLLHDATGARQVSYARIGGQLVCASQASLIATVHDLAVDPRARDFVRTRGDSDFDVYWLPGDRTLYAEVSVLLPNHVLDLKTGRSQRFWPGASALGNADADRVLEDCAARMQGFVLAARNHAGGLAIPMTAGWDSRLVLAMSRSCADDLYCYTLIYPNQTWRTPDVAVPARLLAQLGIAHHVFDYPSTVDPRFRAVCQRSAYNGHEAFCADGQVLLEHYPQERICLTGDVAEIVKCHFRLGPDHNGPVTPADLAALCGIPPLPFALEAFGDWLDAVPDPLPIPLLDLFCWEQMAGRWQAMIRAEYDIVQESFAPLNCRSLLLDMLSVSEEVRTRPDYPFFAGLIRLMWRNVLAEPINPPMRESLRLKVFKAVARSKLHRLLPAALRDKMRLLVRRV